MNYNQYSTETSSMAQSPQDSGVSESYVWCLDSNKMVKEDSLMRWQTKLRHLRDNPQDEYVIQGGPFFKSGLNRIR